MKYFENLNNNYDKLTNFIDEEYLLQLIIGLNIKKISFVDHEHWIACEILKDNLVSTVGDGFISNDNILYINIDKNHQLNVEEFDLVLIEYTQSYRYEIKENIFRNVKLSDRSKHIKF